MVDAVGGHPRETPISNGTVGRRWGSELERNAPPNAHTPKRYPQHSHTDAYGGMVPYRALQQHWLELDDV